MGDAHQVVVDHVGQEVGRQAVGLHQDLHVHAVPWDFYIATQHVGNHADSFGRNLHADDVGFAGGQAALDFLGRQQQGAAVVTRGFATGGLFGAHLVEFFGGAEARECVAHVDQLLGILLVDVAPLALPVRTMWAAYVGAFTPLDAEPAQGVEDLLLGFAGRAQLVGVFDAQDELAAMLFGKAIVEQGDVGRADMGVAGGRWGDTRTNGH